MKHKQLPKSFLLIVIGLSCLSFLYVNVHAGLRGLGLSKPAENTELESVKTQGEEKVKVPDATSLVRLIELGKKIIPGQR